MRVPVLAVLAAALMLAPALAQDAEPAPEEPLDNTVVVEDPTGDVQVAVAPGLGGASQPGSAFGTTFDHLDVTQVWVGDETEDEFTIKLSLKALTPSTGGVTLTSFRFVEFDYGTIHWRVSPGACGGGGRAQTGNTACLSYSGRGFRGGTSVPLTADQAANTYVFVLPKNFVFNQYRVPARFGDSLTNLSAGAVQALGVLPFVPGGDPTGGITASDHAPNDGVGSTFTFLKGGHGTGAIGLTSQQPVRVSNGEATTVVFKVDATNLAEEELSLQVAASEVPQGWDVRVPALVQLPGGGTVTFPVIAAVPFTHEHGATATFRVEARAVEDEGSAATIDLGVYWTDVPQISAHHGGLEYFHSAPIENDFAGGAVRSALPFMEMWFNTATDDPVRPDATDENVPAFFNDGLAQVFFSRSLEDVPPRSSASWFFPLSPSMLIGLDFDVAQVGLMTFDVLPKVPGSGTAVVELVYCDPTKGGFNAGAQPQNFCQPRDALGVVARGESSVSFTPNAAAHVEVTLPIDPAYDLIPFAPGANLGLQIVIATDLPQNAFLTEPRIEFVTDRAELFLPLFEYHDPVDQAFQNVGALRLAAKSPFEKMVNPGETTLFHFDLTNAGEDAEALRLELEGVNRDWATIGGSSAFDLRPGANRSVTVAVTPPAGTAATLSADLFLVAQSQKDPNSVAVIRFKATVTEGEDIANERLDVDGDSKSKTPGPGVALALAMIGLAALRRRRA